MYDGKNGKQIKRLIREELLEHKIVHVTIELETEEEKCIDTNCHIIHSENHHHHHH